MKIAVCVKHVPDRHVRIDPASRRIDRSGSGELNAFDTNAVEEALRIKDATEAEVVVVSMGPEPAAESLRTALGLGADRAALVTDPSAVGSDMVATAKVLAGALRREPFDLVLFGQQASDGSGAVLWAAVAELLQLPVVSQVTEVSVGDGTVRATRQSEFGDDVVEAPMPAVVAVTDAINEPRYASLKGKMGAKKKPLEVLSLEDLGIDPASIGDTGSKTMVLALSEPPARTDAVKITDEGDAAQAIADFLADRQLT
ncbi:MAG: electron transfer flavoprotein subunit beta/FixA family protein [Acidimicrobiales bacterium]